MYAIRYAITYAITYTMMYAMMYAMICVNIGLQAACANDVLPNAIPQFRKA